MIPCAAWPRRIRHALRFWGVDCSVRLSMHPAVGWPLRPSHSRTTDCTSPCQSLENIRVQPAPHLLVHHPLGAKIVRKITPLPARPRCIPLPVKVIRSCAHAADCVRDIAKGTATQTPTPPPSHWTNKLISLPSIQAQQTTRHSKDPRGRGCARHPLRLHLDRGTEVRTGRRGCTPARTQGQDRDRGQGLDAETRVLQPLRASGKQAVLPARAKRLQSRTYDRKL